MLKSIISKLRNKSAQISYISQQLSNFRYFSKRQYLEDQILHCKGSGISIEKYCDYEIIVSLTSYGKRLKDVCFSIESIMQQTMKANKIVLNISRDCIKNIPIALRMQEKRGLTIDIVEDIRSYKKLIPTLRKYPNAIVITIDDDLIYDFDIVERLYNSYLQHPRKISALRTHTLSFDKNHKLSSYNSWFQCCDRASSPFHLFPTTGGGTLFPPHCFSEEVFNAEVFSSICPTADDVWFHAMAIINGTSFVKVETRDKNGEEYIINEDVQDIALYKINTGEAGRNDEQIKAVYEKYGIYDLLK